MLHKFFKDLFKFFMFKLKVVIPSRIGDSTKVVEGSIKTDKKKYSSSTRHYNVNYYKYFIELCTLQCKYLLSQLNC